jgi:hypothetical protein
MPKRSSKSQDVNELAFGILAKSTGQGEEPSRDAVSAAAAALGRRGGLKGGPARAKSLSAGKRRAIAKKAAAARWKRTGLL